MTSAPRWVSALTAVVLQAVPAAAQHAGAAPGSPDVPAGPATVVGRLVHATRPEAVGNLEVILYALSADGSGGLRQQRTDADGSFRFERVSNAPEVIYLVGARLGDIPFGSRFAFAPGESEHRVELALSDPIFDASVTGLGNIDLRVERGCTHLRVSHRHAVTNPGERVVHAPEDARDGIAPIFEVVLPAGAEGFETGQGRDGLVRDGDRVRFFGPVYPGSQAVEFGYGLPFDTTQIEIGLPGRTPEVSVLTPEGVLLVTSSVLAPAPGVTLGEQRYAVQRAAPFEASTLALSLALTERPPSSLRTPRAELWVELDDAALEVNERLEVMVGDGDGLAESIGEPLLCMPLPAGATELRFSNETLRAGLRRDPSGDLAFHGPLPHGPTPLAVSYRLPADGSGVAFERRYDRALPLLSVLVADNGVVPETTRMHRRRPVRSGERMFQHLEAFAVEALEAVEIDLRRTPPRRDRGRWASTGFALLAGLASLGFLIGPLRDAAPDADGRAEPDLADAAELEREAFARALMDLDDDLETGKLTAADHAAMRAELRARAAASLLREPPAPAPTAIAKCPGCGSAPHPEDRFCSRCGARLDSGPPA